MIQQPAFAVHAASISGKLAIGSDDTVARHYDGHWIRSISQTHRARCSRATDACGQFSIGFSFAGGDVAECGPHLALKRGAIGLHRDLREGFEIAAKIGFNQTAEYGPGRLRRADGSSVMQAQQTIHAVFVIGEVESAHGGTVGDKQDLANGRGDAVNE